MIVPITVTGVIISAWLLFTNFRSRSHGDYSGIGEGLLDFITLLAAIVVVLVVWLVWALS